MKSFRQLGIALAALWMFGSLAFGQAARTATVVGTVTDSTGAVVPDAKVTLTNKDTAFVSNGVTQSDGSYYIPFLAVGSYGLSVEAAEFKRYLQSGHPTGSRRGAAPGCQDGHRRSDRIRASRRRSPATTDRDSGFSRLLILSKLDLQPCLVHPCR